VLIDSNKRKQVGEARLDGFGSAKALAPLTDDVLNEQLRHHFAQQRHADDDLSGPRHVAGSPGEADLEMRGGKPRGGLNSRPLLPRPSSSAPSGGTGGA
jgi:hypothetical protein